MSENSFDDIVREKLHSLGGDPQIASWDLMKSHMEEQSMPIEMDNTEQWDQMIKNTIDNYEAPFNPQHQEEFIQQFKNYKTAKRRTLYSYISRAVIILLLIFSTVHLYDFVGPKSSTNFTTNNNDNKTNIENRKWNQNNTLLVSSINERSNVQNNLDKKVEVSKPLSKSEYFSSSEPVPMNSEFVYITDQINESNQYNNVEPINNQIALLNHTQNDLILKRSKQANIPVVNRQSNDLRLGAWVSYDNTINYKNNNDNYNGGIRSTGVSISKKMGNLEIETGVEYSRVEFDPSLHNNLYGSETNLQTLVVENVDLVVSSVPISAKYHFPINDKTSIYSTVTSKYNTILTNNSKKSKSAYNTLRSPQNNISRRPPSLEGVLQGGSLKDNSFITASVGVGLEMQFQDNLIAFVEPSYETQIVPSNFSLTENKYKGIGLKLGVKKRI